MVENKVIQVTSIGAMAGFFVIMAKNLPNVHAIDTSQCL